MADTKISALPASTTPLAGTEVVPLVQSGVTKNVSVANLTAGRAVSMSGLTVTPAADTNAAATVQAASRTTAGQSEARLNLTAVSRETTNNRQATYALRVDPDNDFGASALRIDYTYDGVSLGTRFGINSAGNLFQGAAGKGFDFNANTPAAGMTSQLLNWYEEGTWTPSIANSFNNYVHTIQVGRYTRVGNLVTVQFTIAWTTTNAGGFSFTIDGLPFTPVTLTNYASGGSIGKVDRLTTVKQVMCQVESATASIKFYELNTGAVATALASASWNVAGSANLVSGTVTYQV